MATGKEQYYALDDIGFMGDQKRTEAQWGVSIYPDSVVS